MSGDLISRTVLLEHIWREKVDSRERIAELIEKMPSEEHMYSDEEVQKNNKRG